jgi:Uma2 family endonuclease
MQQDKLPTDPQSTIPEFLAFTGTRPDGERWELIEGEAVIYPSPTMWHQVIAADIVRAPGNAADQTNATWTPLPGVGTKVPVSPNSLPQPDVMVIEGPALPEPTTGDALVLFEILSKSNTRADQVWRRKVYASIPNCRHYVTVSSLKVEVVRYDRDANWREAKLQRLTDTLEPLALGASLPLAAIYRHTGLREGRS